MKAEDLKAALRGGQLTLTEQPLYKVVTVRNRFLRGPKRVSNSVWFEELYYKVLRRGRDSSLWSCAVDLSPLAVVYVDPERNIVEGDRIYATYGPLFTFNSETAALGFLASIRHPSDCEIWSCIVGKPRLIDCTLQGVESPEYVKSFWQHIDPEFAPVRDPEDDSVEFHHFETVPAPIGTVGVSWLELRERIL